MKIATWRGHPQEVMNAMSAMLTREGVTHTMVERDGELVLTARRISVTLKENIDAMLKDETFEFTFGRTDAALKIPGLNELPSAVVVEAASSVPAEPADVPDKLAEVLDELAEVLDEPAEVRDEPAEVPDEPAPVFEERLQKPPEVSPPESPEVQGEIREETVEAEVGAEMSGEEEGPDAGATKSSDDGGTGGGEVHEPEGEEPVCQDSEGQDEERDTDLNIAQETRNLRDTLTAKEAIQVIATMDNMTALKTWKKQDGRVTVKRAIDTRIKELKELED